MNTSSAIAFLLLSVAAGKLDVQFLREPPHYPPISDHFASFGTLATDTSVSFGAAIEDNARETSGAKISPLKAPMPNLDHDRLP